MANLISFLDDMRKKGAISGPTITKTPTLAVPAPSAPRPVQTKAPSANSISLSSLNKSLKLNSPITFPAQKTPTPNFVTASSLQKQPSQILKPTQTLQRPPIFNNSQLGAGGSTLGAANTVRNSDLKSILRPNFAKPALTTISAPKTAPGVSKTLNFATPASHITKSGLDNALNGGAIKTNYDPKTDPKRTYAYDDAFNINATGINKADDENKYYYRSGMIGQTFGSVLGDEAGYKKDWWQGSGGGNINTDNIAANADKWSLRYLLDKYNTADGDAQADTKAALQKAITNIKYSDEAKNNDPDAMENITFLSNLLSALNQYGADKGKSMGRQIWDTASNGGFVGDLADPLIQAAAPVLGQEDQQNKQQEIRNIELQDRGVVGAVDNAMGIVGNTGINLATGGWSGIAQAGLNTADMATNLDDKVLDYGEGGQAIMRDKTAGERIGEVGSTAINDLFTIAGKSNLNKYLPNLGVVGQSGANITKLTLKDLAKYAAKELPFAAGTTLAQEGFKNMAQGKNFIDYDAGELLKNFGYNLGQDVAMDAVGRGRAIRETQAQNMPQTNKLIVEPKQPDASQKLSDWQAKPASNNPIEWTRQLPKNTTEVKSVRELISSKFEPYKQKLAVVLRGTNRRTAEVVKQATGSDVSRYDHTVDSYAVKHAIERHKGDLIPLKSSDIEKIPEIIKTADSIEYGGKNKKGLDTVLYKKEYEDRVVYLEEVRNKRRELAMNTMYWQPKTKSTAAANSQDNPTSSLRALPRQQEGANVNSVAKTAQKVNSVGEERAKSKQSQSILLQKNQNNSDVANKAVSELSKEYDPIINKDLESVAMKQIHRDGLANTYEKSLQRMKDRRVKNMTPQDKAIALKTLQILGTKSDDVSVGRFTELSQRLAESSRDQAQQLQLNRIIRKQSEAGMLHTGLKSIEQSGGEVTPQITKEAQALIKKFKSYNPQIEALQGRIDKATDPGTARRLGAELREVQNQQGYAASTYADFLGRQSKSQNKLGSFYRAMLLSGVKTQTKNAVANTSNFATNKLTDFVAKPIDKAISAFSKKTSIQPTMRGTLAGVKEGGKQAAKLLKTGLELGDSSAVYEGKGRSEVRYKNKVADKVFGVPTRAIFRVVSAGDKPTRQAGKLNALYEEASVLAKNKGLKGKVADLFIEKTVANPSDAVLARAVERGEDVVFGSRNALSDAINKISNSLTPKPTDAKAVKAFKTAAKFLTVDTTIPFVKVPTNVAIKGFVDYNPVGAVKSLIQAGNAKHNGKFDVAAQAKLARGLSKALIGTGAQLAGYALATNGMITGGYPTDEKEKARWEAEGITPNSIKIGDSYYQLGPLTLLFQPALIGANVQKRVAEGGDLLTSYGGALLDSAKALQDIPVLQGVKDLTELLTGDNYGNPGVINDPAGAGDAVSNFIEDKLLALTVPNLVRSVATSTDPKVRQTEYGNFAENLMSRVPGLRQMLPEKSDVFGNELENMSFLSGFFDPLTISQARQGDNSMIKELDRLSRVSGDTDIGEGEKEGLLNAWSGRLGASSGVKGEDGKNIKFTSEQRAAAQRIIGEQINQRYNEVMRSDDYKNADDQEKYNMLMKSRNTVEQSDIKKAVLANEDVADGGFTQDDVASTKTGYNKKGITINNRLGGEYKNTLTKYQSMDNDDWNDYLNTVEGRQAEYKLAKAKYENDLANGDITNTQKINRDKELKKLSVSQYWDKSVREAYGLAGNRADTQDVIVMSGNPEDMRGYLNAMNRAMYDAGVITSSTYKTRNRNINDLEGSGGGANSAYSASARAALDTYTKGLSGTDATDANSGTKAPATGRKMVKTSINTSIRGHNLGAAPKITIKKGVA